MQKRKSSKKKSFVEEDCGPGCLSVRTDIESGVVHCSGDGVDESLRYPGDVHCKLATSYCKIWANFVQKMTPLLSQYHCDRYGTPIFCGARKN